jgi:SPP1 gp7 family putative phage head morphogenesis protein
MAATEMQIDAANRLQIVLESAKQDQANRIGREVAILGNEIASILISIDDFQSLTVNELNRLLEDVGLVVSGYIGGMYTSNLDVFVSDVIGLSVDVEVDTLNEAIETKDFEAKRPSEDEIYNEYNNTPVTDGPSAELLAGLLLLLATSESSRIKNTIRSSYFNGLTMQETMREVMGYSKRVTPSTARDFVSNTPLSTNALLNSNVGGALTASSQPSSSKPAKKITSGALVSTQRNAESVMKTIAQHAMASSRTATFKINEIKKYEWVSTLDSRTTTQCKSLDGQVFEIGKGPMPPIHYNCRSTVVAYLSDRETVNDSDGTRAARGESGKTSRVDANITYYDWLRKQPADFQDRAIGKTRGSLFRNGGLTSEEFRKLNLNRNFMPLTLEEMRAIDPKSFTRAGI